MKGRSHQVRVLAILGLLGGITAVPLILAFSQTGWGLPGTSAYQTYELLNRSMAVSLLLMSAGWFGVILIWPNGYGRYAAILAFIGSLIMVAGNAAEFWLFSDLPYGSGSNWRNTAWSVFGIGSMLLDVGAMILGVAVWRSRLWPRWSALILMLAFPIDLAAYFLLGSPFGATAVLALLIGTLLLFVGDIPAQSGTAIQKANVL